MVTGCIIDSSIKKDFGEQNVGVSLSILQYLRDLIGINLNAIGCHRLLEIMIDLLHGHTE